MKLKHRHRMDRTPVFRDRPLKVRLYNDGQRRKPWVWEVEAASILHYEFGGTWAKPGPHHVRGRCRTEAEAAELMQQCVQDVRDRVAVEIARANVVKVGTTTVALTAPQASQSDAQPQEWGITHDEGPNGSTAKVARPVTEGEDHP